TSMAASTPSVSRPPVTTPAAVLAARRIADEVLKPNAEHVDVTGVRRETLDLFATEGLLGLVGPQEYGGAAASGPVVREVVELLGGADGATWFVSAQHTLPLLAVARTQNEALKERVLRAMCAGTLISGVAIAHVRRPSTPAVTAVRESNGWRYDGTVAWMTAWGLCDVFLLGGLSPDGELVLSLLEARDQPGLQASEQLQLAAMQATATVQLHLDGLFVADADVVEVTDAAAWLLADAAKSANVVPAVFGLLRTILDLLAPTAPELAQRMTDEGARIRTEAYRLIDEVRSGEQVERRLELRAEAIELAVRAATALVVASGGRAMSLSAAPQRLLREAAFHTVQAQTAPVRAATLRHLLSRS
ncbi:MAG: acyl-CoA dehydrogenase family protein, partial [Mycobacteriales bacterium]